MDLSKVKVIEKVLDTAFDKPSFQVSRGLLLGVQCTHLVASSLGSQLLRIAAKKAGKPGDKATQLLVSVIDIFIAEC